MFDKNSRYRTTETCTFNDTVNGEVTVVAVPDAPTQSLLGLHLHKNGQRLDHLAAHYLNDPAGFWRLAEMNNAMLPDSVTSQSEIMIPQKTNNT